MFAISCVLKLLKVKIYIFKSYYLENKKCFIYFAVLYITNIKIFRV